MTTTDLTARSGDGRESPGPSVEPAASGSAAAAPDRAEGRGRRRAAATAVGVVAGSTAAIALGTLIGAWFMPFLVGAAVGAVGRLRSARLWRGASAVALAGALGWALPLGRQALGGAPVGEVARTAAALAGLPPLATVTVSAALLIAVVQALVGFWVGRTVVPRRG